MKRELAIFAAAFIPLSVCASASADDFARQWDAALDGEKACRIYSHVDHNKIGTDDSYAAICAEIHRLFEAMRPGAEQRYRDAEQRWVTKRLENDLRAARR